MSKRKKLELSQPVAKESETEKTLETAPPAEEISDLKEDIAQAQSVLDGSTPPPKRGRPKGPSVKKAEREAQAEAAKSQVTEMMDGMRPIFTTLASLPFAVAAAKTEYPGWALSKEEAEAIGAQIDFCARFYLPQMNSEHAPLMMLGFTVFACAAGRYYGYMKYQDSLKPSTQEEPQNPAGQTPQPDFAGYPVQ